jgi:hypothetical protein
MVCLTLWKANPDVSDPKFHDDSCRDLRFGDVLLPCLPAQSPWTTPDEQQCIAFAGCLDAYGCQKTSTSSVLANMVDNSGLHLKVVSHPPSRNYSYSIYILQIVILTSSGAWSRLVSTKSTLLKFSQLTILSRGMICKLPSRYLIRCKQHTNTAFSRFASSQHVKGRGFNSHSVQLFCLAFACLPVGWRWIVVSVGRVRGRMVCFGRAGEEIVVEPTSKRTSALCF